MRAEQVQVGQLLGPVFIDVEGTFAGEDETFEVEFPRRGAGGRTLLVHGGRPHPVVSFGSHSLELERLADAAAPTLSWAQRVDEHTALVEVRIFDAELSLGPQVVSVPAEVAEQLFEHLDSSTLDDPALLDEFVLPDLGSGSRVILGSGAAADEIHLVGRTSRLRLDTTDGLRAVELIRHTRRARGESLRIARGTFSLVDRAPVDSPLLGALATATAPMFDLWQTYNDLELAAAETRASEIGQARHGRPDYRDDLVILPIRAAEDADFLTELSRERSHTEVEIVPAEVGFEGGALAIERFIGTVEHVDTVGKTITVRQRKDRRGVITTDGLVRPHLGGAAVQAARRQAVYDRLRAGDHAIAALGPILREQRPPTTARVKHRAAVTDAVRKVVPGPITPAQQRAIDIAINTPDIALIQGPPGTGKSQVIAAIEQRLAELAPRGSARLILLTSVQHDAVDLVAARTNIFGLPARRIAPRRSDIDSPIARWRKERIAALRRYNETRQGSRLSRWLDDVLDVYDQTPSTPAAAADLLEEVVDRCGSELDVDLRTRMNDRAQALRIRRNRSRLAADLRAARGLRITPEGHADDGPQQAQRVLRRPLTTVEGWADRIVPVLERVADGTETDLSKVADLRSALVDGLLHTEVIGGATLADQQTRDLLAAARAQVAASRDRPITPEEAVDLFMLDLELDDFGVERTIAEYTAVWASTCQGSATLFVGDFGSDRSLPPFPTVVVDEAARANPLDLLIPMVQAGERIILVGDHRQLPQLVDETLRYRVGEQSRSTDASLLDQTLFERLFRHLERLEAETGTPRAVTLDVQFRMHPALGAFVSRVFYEPYGEGFTSGRPASEFEHGISRFGDRVAAWVDVPTHLGRPTRRGTSLCRSVEARAVADLAAGILEEAPHLSVGVITFYAAQQELILEELAAYGITELSEDGVSITEPYRALETASGRREERLRVGTVDSFQGKEFDVVVLSMVRTGRASAGASDADMFGFLTSENRTCVALSRQKRLLIVVGDRSIVDLPHVEQVRGLLELAELCGAPL